MLAALCVPLTVSQVLRDETRVNELEKKVQVSCHLQQGHHMQNRALGARPFASIGMLYTTMKHVRVNELGKKVQVSRGRMTKAHTRSMLGLAAKTHTQIRVWRAVAVSWASHEQEIYAL